MNFKDLFEKHDDDESEEEKARAKLEAWLPPSPESLARTLVQLHRERLDTEITLEKAREIIQHEFGEGEAYNDKCRELFFGELLRRVSEGEPIN